MSYKVIAAGLAAPRYWDEDAAEWVLINEDIGEQADGSDICAMIVWGDNRLWIGGYVFLFSDSTVHTCVYELDGALTVVDPADVVKVTGFCHGAMDTTDELYCCGTVSSGSCPVRKWTGSGWSAVDGTSTVLRGSALSIAIGEFPGGSRMLVIGAGPLTIWNTAETEQLGEADLVLYDGDDWSALASTVGTQALKTARSTNGEFGPMRILVAGDFSKLIEPDGTQWLPCGLIEWSPSGFALPAFGGGSAEIHAIAVNG